MKRDMNILVPLNDTSHVEEFIEAGATELYMGFYDTHWDEMFGPYHDINRLSGFGANANRYCIEELIIEINNINQTKYSKKPSIYITLNASAYARDEMSKLKEYLLRLKECQIAGVIVPNLELSMLAHGVGVPVVISTIAGVYNAETVKVYKEFGASRVILPRDVSMHEIEQIVQEVPDMEYEIFLMRNGCAFSDSNCLGFHRKEKCSVCSSLCEADVKHHCQDTIFPLVQENHAMYSHEFHEYACGLCSIYDFLQLGIAACKIVGRSEDYEAICRDIRYVSENIQIAKSCNNREEYLNRMRYPDLKDKMCKNGLSCYYPEICFK